MIRSAAKDDVLVGEHVSRYSSLLGSARPGPQIASVFPPSPSAAVPLVVAADHVERCLAPDARPRRDVPRHAQLAPSPRRSRVSGAYLVRRLYRRGDQLDAADVDGREIDRRIEPSRRILV